MANKGGYALEHRIIMSEHLGRPLQKNEFVYHKNGNRADNRIENLKVVSAKDLTQSNPLLVVLFIRNKLVLPVKDRCPFIKSLLLV